MVLFVSSTAKVGQKEARNTKSKTQDNNRDKRSRVSLEVSVVSSWHLLSTPSFRYSFLSRHVIVDDFVRQLFETSKFHQGTLTIIIYLVIFVGVALKLEKADPTLSNFNPSPPFPSVAIDDRKQDQSLNMILNSKIEPLFFGIQLKRTRF